MARTVCTKYTERQIKHPGDGLGWEGAVKALIPALQEQYESSQADADKAGDVDDAAYYEGQVDILTWVLGMLTVEPDDAKRDRLERDLNDVRRVIDQTDRDDALFQVLHKRADDIAQELHDLDNLEGAS